MNFISIDYIFFLPTVFLLYRFLFKNLKYQNLLLVIASYTFSDWDRIDRVVTLTDSEFLKIARN